MRPSALLLTCAVVLTSMGGYAKEEGTPGGGQLSIVARMDTPSLNDSVEKATRLLNKIDKKYAPMLGMAMIGLSFSPQFGHVDFSKDFKIMEFRDKSKDGMPGNIPLFVFSPKYGKPPRNMNVGGQKQMILQKDGICLMSPSDDVMALAESTMRADSGRNDWPRNGAVNSSTASDSPRQPPDISFDIYFKNLLDVSPEVFDMARTEGMREIVKGMDKKAPRHKSDAYLKYIGVQLDYLEALLRQVDHAGGEILVSSDALTIHPAVTAAPGSKLSAFMGLQKALPTDFRRPTIPDAPFLSGAARIHAGKFRNHVIRFALDIIMEMKSEGAKDITDSLNRLADSMSGDFGYCMTLAKDDKSVSVYHAAAVEGKSEDFLSAADAVAAAAADGESFSTRQGPGRMRIFEAPAQNGMNPIHVVYRPVGNGILLAAGPVDAAELERILDTVAFSPAPAKHSEAIHEAMAWILFKPETGSDEILLGSTRATPGKVDIDTTLDVEILKFICKSIGKIDGINGTKKKKPRKNPR